MKRVTRKNNSSEWVYSEDCSEKKFYGVVSPRNWKGVITRNSYKEGTFEIRAIECFTSGNRAYDGSNITNLYEYLNKITDENKDSLKVFEFDTFKEMALWLAE